MSDDLLCDIFKNIYESIALIEDRFSKISSPKDFVLTPEGVVLLEAVDMRLQIVGEQLSKVHKINPEFLNKYSGVEWKKIIDLRNIISHHYEKLDHEIIFHICKDDIPLLKNQIEKVLLDLRCF